jgi:hypothetical protein
VKRWITYGEWWHDEILRSIDLVQKEAEKEAEKKSYQSAVERWSCQTRFTYVLCI